MSLDNVHPVVLERVLKQLPAGVTITSAVSENENVSIFVANYKGSVRRVPMAKADVKSYFVNRKVTLEVAAGTKLADVYSLLSDTFKLYLLPGVDFNVPEGDVEFDSVDGLELGLDILPNSISLKGNIGFTVINCDRQKFPVEQLENRLNLQHLKLALVSTIFAPTGKVFSGDNLTGEFSKQVINHLNSLKLDHKLTVENIQASTVLDDLRDGFSRVVFINTVKELPLAIRYDANEKDAPSFKTPNQNTNSELQVASN